MKTILKLALTLATASLAACDLGEFEDGGAGEEGTSDPDEDEDDVAGAEEDDGADADAGSDEHDDAADSAGADDEPGGSDPPSDDDAGGAAGDIPPELLGLWIVSDSAVALYEFRADGTYISGNRAETTFGSCTNVYQLLAEGEFSVSGDVLELVPTSGWKHYDECGTVTEETYLPSPSQRVWTLGQDEYGETLTLEDESGPVTLHRG